MRTLLMLGLLALCVPILAQSVYKTVDEDGNVTYSDEPPEGDDNASEADLPKLNEVPRQQRHRQPSRSQSREQQPEAPDYQLELLSPEPDTSVPPGQRNLTIAVRLAPGLARGHQLVYYQGDKRLTASRQSTYTIEEITRGTHQIRVTVEDENGQVITRAGPVPIHVHRPSILLPAGGQ